MRWPWQRDKPAVTMSATVPRTFSLGWDAFPWWEQQATQYGKVTRDFALSVAAVLKGRNIVCGTISSLPLLAVDADFEAIRSPLLEQIDPDVANPVTMASLVEDLLFESIGWLRVLARDSNNYPVKARRIDPSVVTATPPPGYTLADLPSGYVPGSTLWVGGEPVAARNMLRFDSPLPPLLLHGARTIRRMYRLEQAAEMYAASPQMRGWFSPADNADPQQEAITAFLDDWRARREAGVDGYVPSAFVRHAEEVPTPADLQVAQILEKTTVAVADLFGLDPEDLGVSTTSRTYQNAVDRRQDKKNETYAGLCTAIEARLSMGDITRRGQRAVFDWDEYLQPNPTDRADIADKLIGAKVITRDEARYTERRPPLTAAQKAELNPPAPEPAPEPAQPVGEPQDGDQDTEPSNVVPIRKTQNFAGDAAGIVFDSADSEVTVNVSKRTITGRVVGWRDIGRKDGMTWRVAPGAFVYNPAHINQIKLFSDHDPVKSVGYTMRAWTDADGQWATWKVTRGPAGDQALLEAADGAKDGLSPGLGFADGTGFEYIADPENPGGYLITRAVWRETSLLALPAFGGSRVTSVEMTADPTGASMPCQTCGHTHAVGVACPTTPPTQQPPAPAPAPAPANQPSPAPAPAVATFSAEQALQLFQGNPELGAEALKLLFSAPKPAGPPLSADQITALRNVPGGDQVIAKAFGITLPQPAVVNPTALPIPGQPAPGNAQVKEQPLYRFDGHPAQRCFTADLKNKFGGDAALIAKAEEFTAAAMAKSFAAIAVADVDELNPVIQRPDLFVPKLTFNRVLGSMTQGGAVTSLTAFKYPKFNADSGLAAAHTPGTEPTEGAVSTTSGDVNPAGLSGLLILQREVIDQGGNPQLDSLLWSLMTQAYAEALEGRMQDMFQALALSATPVVGVDGILSQNLLTILTGLQFIRGGDRYSAFAADSTLYAALAGAMDGDDRPLFPMEAPANASGGVAGDLGSIRAHGKTIRPAWALETGNGGEGGLSYLWAPGSVYQWFSAPRRIDLEIAVATVRIGIWGYSAEFCTRSTDVKELAYSQA